MSYTEPIDYFEQYDRYRYQDPRFPGSPLKEDWWWELNEPTSDSQVSNRVKSTFPMEDFYNDVLLNADPLFQGALADVWEGGDRTLTGAISYYNSPEYKQALLDRIGKTEWNQLRERGLLTDENLPGEELDKQAKSIFDDAIMNLLATGSPSAQRNMGFWDAGSERYGGRPYPGGELPGFEGPGFGGPEGGGPGGGGQGQPSPVDVDRNTYYTALMDRINSGAPRDDYYEGVRAQALSHPPSRPRPRTYSTPSRRNRDESRSARLGSRSGASRAALRGVKNVLQGGRNRGSRRRNGSSNNRSNRPRGRVNPRTFTYGR